MTIHGIADIFTKMNITILNGNPEKKNRAFDRYLAAVSGQLASGGNSVRTFTLRDMNIRHCTGCWNCWVKTPGLCTLHDDMPDIYRATMASDLLVLASPVIMGFVSALLKRANERLIPLLHPYAVLDRGECHHLARYDRYPDLGLVLKGDADTDDEDIRIISDIYRREALNFKSRLRFAIADRTAKEASDAIAAS
jgi:hypothetical protein